MVRMSTVALDILSWKLLWDSHVKISSRQLDKWEERGRGVMPCIETLI